MTTGRVAIVTGAAGGIGSAVVAALLADGYRVVAVDACTPMPGAASSAPSTAALAQLAEDGAGRVTTVVADVRDAGAVQQLVADVEATHGRLDAVVAAAGAIAGGAAAWEAPAGELDVMLDVNLRGVWNLAAAAIPAMLRRPVPRSGRFVAIASAAAHRGLWHLTAYAASKHAVVGLVRGLAVDLRGTGATAAAVSPGATRTPMLEASAALYGLEEVERLAEGHLVERVLAPEEIAEAVRWLCSPRAAAVTGTVIHTDGGFTA